jgi:hypothetical protein
VCVKSLYYSFEAISTSPFFIGDPEQDPNVNHRQASEPLDTKDDIPSPIPDSTLTKITRKYRPLKLPSILHDFPTKNYRYLHVFDGELEKISAEKHVHDFEHFTDLFEIEHDNVLMRDFS